MVHSCGAVVPAPPLQKKGIDEDDVWLLGGKKGGKGKGKAKKGEGLPGASRTRRSRLRCESACPCFAALSPLSKQAEAAFCLRRMLAQCPPALAACCPLAGQEGPWQGQGVACGCAPHSHTTRRARPWTPA